MKMIIDTVDSVQTLCCPTEACYLFYFSVHWYTSPHGGFLLQGLTMQLGQFM